MRAKDFLLEADKTISITVPINITIPSGDSEPTVKSVTATDKPPVMVPPLQQHIELAKQGAGKDSTVIDQLTADDYKEPAQQEIAPADNILRQQFKDLQDRLQQALKSLG